MLVNNASTTIGLNRANNGRIIPGAANIDAILKGKLVSSEVTAEEKKALFAYRRSVREGAGNGKAFNHTVVKRLKGIDSLLGLKPEPVTNKRMNSLASSSGFPYMTIELLPFRDEVIDLPIDLPFEAKTGATLGDTGITYNSVPAANKSGRFQFIFSDGNDSGSPTIIEMGGGEGPSIIQEGIQAGTILNEIGFLKEAFTPYPSPLIQGHRRARLNDLRVFVPVSASIPNIE